MLVWAVQWVVVVLSVCCDGHVPHHQIIIITITSAAAQSLSGPVWVLIYNDSPNKVIGGYL